MTKNVKIVVYVPISHADALREALAKAGAGRIGNYEACSFSSKGLGRFRPLKGAKPHIGEVGKSEEVEEERIEVNCLAEELEGVLEEIRIVHPYEEPVVDVYDIR